MALTPEQTAAFTSYITASLAAMRGSVNDPGSPIPPDTCVTGFIGAVFVGCAHTLVSSDPDVWGVQWYVDGADEGIVNDGDAIPQSLIDAVMPE